MYPLEVRHLLIWVQQKLTGPGALTVRAFFFGIPLACQSLHFLPGMEKAGTKKTVTMGAENQ